jgi:hypothetical protein
MPFKEVLTYPFKDERWAGKITIGVLLFLAAYIIPIIPMLFVMGYYYQIMHRILVEDGELYLPEWTDWGKLLQDGWRLFCVNFLYGLPALIFFLIGTGIYFVGITGMSIGMAESNSPEQWLPILFIGMGVMFLCFGVGFILAIVSSIVMPPAMCNAVKYDTYKAAFRFEEWWKVLKANFSGFVIALIFIYGLFTLVMFVAQIFNIFTLICCLLYVVVFACSYYMALVMFALIPLVYKEGLEMVEEKSA